MSKVVVERMTPVKRPVARVKIEDREIGRALVVQPSRSMDNALTLYIRSLDGYSKLNDTRVRISRTDLPGFLNAVMELGQQGEG